MCVAVCLLQDVRQATARDKQDNRRDVPPAMPGERMAGGRYLAR
jgi:hypothetical protein